VAQAPRLRARRRDPASPLATRRQAGRTTGVFNRTFAGGKSL